MRKAILIPVLLTAACGFFASTPDKVVRKYLDSLSKEKYEAAYRQVSLRDRAAKNLEAFSSEMSGGANPVLPNPAGRARIDLQDVSVDGERARVRVGVTPAGLAAGASPDAHAFRLLREDGSWRLFLGWEAQALVAEARRLREEGKLEEALEKYGKAVELDPDSAEADQGRSELDRQIQTRHAMQEYLQNNVEIIGFRVTRGSGRGTAASISGRLLNNGHRTLSEVEIGVYFLSADGKVIGERTYRPIPSSDVTYYGEDRTLRRGAVREFGYIVEGTLPRSWSGKARAVVTRIEFEEKG